MNIRILTAGSLFLAISGWLPGCARQSGRPATYPVQGNITYQGKPVADATVAFLADGAPRPAVGTTDGAGEFRLTTFELNDGAIPGTHVVTVVKRSTAMEEVIPTAEEMKSGQVDPQAVEAAMEQAALQLTKARSELPAKYANRNTSDLRREVVDGENVFTIELAD